MSTPLPNVSDPCGYYGDLAVTVYCGPAELGEDRRCISLAGLSGSSGEIAMTVPQWLALVDTLADHGATKDRPPRERPRVIEAVSRSHGAIYVGAGGIRAIEIESGGGHGAGAGWTARILLDTFTCYRTFETEEEAKTFARETLG